MISSSKILSGLNADGDHQKSIFIQKKSRPINVIQPFKRMRTTETETHLDKQPEEFFFQAHPFSDLILLIQDKEFYVDKSILAAGSKVFQSYFQDEDLDSIEILDVSPTEMIELLQFLYPQFQCTIKNDNVTMLLILAHRFEIRFLSSACRTFILLYLSELQYVRIHPDGGELFKQEDGTRLDVSEILSVLCIWFDEFQFTNDSIACQTVLDKIGRCRCSSILGSQGFTELEEKMKWKILQARAKYLENRRIPKEKNSR